MILQPKSGRNSGNCGQKAGNTGTGKIEEVFRGIGSFQGNSSVYGNP